MKSLLPFIMEGTDSNTLFIDCFAGGMNVISERPSKNKIAMDTNKYIIALWNEIKNKGIENLDLPKDSDELTRELYEDIKQSYINGDNKYSDYLIGFVGSACSYGGAWFNGYAQFNPNKNEDHIKEAYNGLVKHAKSFLHLDKTFFFHLSYEGLGHNGNIPYNTVLFCDPPYMNTKKYESDFDHKSFWQWVRNINNSVSKILVTEYSAPADFKCIWEQEKKDGMGTTIKGKKQNTKTEKLFIYEQLQ